MKGVILVFFLIFIDVFLFSAEAYIYKDSILVENYFTNNSELLIPDRAFDVNFEPESIKIVYIVKTNFYSDEIKEIVEKYSLLTNEIASISNEIYRLKKDYNLTEKRALLFERIILAISQNSSLKNIETFLSAYFRQYEKELKNKDEIQSKIDNLTEKFQQKKDEAFKLLSIMNENTISYNIYNFDRKYSGRVTYRLNGSWVPVYYFNREAKTLDMKMKLVFNQKIEFEVTKCRVLNYNYTPGYLGKVLNRSRIYLREKFTIARSKMLKESRGFSVEEDKTSSEEVAVGGTQTGFMVEINRKLRLKNNLLISLLTNINIDFSESYFCIPLKSSWGYYALNISNTSKIPLLEGKFFIVSKGEFISPFNLSKTVLPSENYEFHGIETKEIEVKRENVEDFFDNPDLLRATVINVKTFEISIKNRLNKDIFLSVLDRIPLASDDRIKLKDVKVTDKKSEEIIAKDGIINWKLPMRAGEEKKLSISYKIEYPKDFNYIEVEE